MVVVDCIPTVRLHLRHITNYKSSFQTVPILRKIITQVDECWSCIYPRQVSPRYTTVNKLPDIQTEAAAKIEQCIMPGYWSNSTPSE